MTKKSLSGLFARTRGWWCGALLLAAMLAPRAASAVQSAELYRTQAYFYGRFEARIRFAPGEGVVSSFFLWRDGSSMTTSWNELDYEKINAACRLQTNVWSGKGTQSSQINTPTFNICNDYHTYAFEWTPDYIAWLIDGTQIRKVTGSVVNDYTQNASQGMSMHFNTWAGNSTFGGVLDPSTLPVHEFISWVQYSSYSNGSFSLQWREDFNGSTMPDNFGAGDWASPYNLSTHNMANVTFNNGIAVLSMTADNATGFTGTPPDDPAGGGSGSGGTSGSGGASASGGTSGSGGASASGGTSGSSGGSGSGGTTGSGGGSGSGGSTASGGGSASGGKSGSGGASASGGLTGSGGGLASSGGVTGSGGESSSTGGNSSGSGGSTSGGTSSGGTSGGSESGGGGGCQAAGGGPMGPIGLVAASLMAAQALRRRRKAPVARAS